MTDVATVIGGGMTIEARRAHDEALVREYHAALTEFGVDDFSWEKCWEGYKFGLVRPFFNLLLIAGKYKKERDTREGIFSAETTPADETLAKMYHELNARLAAALTDHKWVEMAHALDVTGRACCRPCS